MDLSNIYELIGFIGSIVVAISLVMNSLLKLRWYNLVGASMFSLYGFLIGSWPVALLNLFISVVDAYYLIKFYKSKELFKFLHVRNENRYLDYFIDYHRVDIEEYFPGFYETFKNFSVNDPNTLCFLVLRNAAVAGVFIAHKKSDDDDVLHIDIDYVIPEYRDLKIGRYILVENESYFKVQGYNKLVALPKSKKHYDYLKKMGFSEDPDEDGRIYLSKYI